MTTEIQWRCKDEHRDCEAKDWRHYKLYTESDADIFIKTIAPNSRHFEFRINPEPYPPK